MRLLTRAALASLTLAVIVSGCATTTTVPTGLADVMQRPAEGSLLSGMRAYDDANYALAETLLRSALSTGLVSGKDQATAHKLLAFLLCSSDRLDDCEAEFRAARRADAAFALGKSEVGHPLWGPVYRRLQ